MQPKEQKIKKSDLIYIIYNSIRKDSTHATLAICIHHKADTITDVLTIEWKCELLNKKPRWKDLEMNWEYNNFNLADLISKLKALQMTPKSTIEQVIEMLKQAGVEQGLATDVMDERRRVIYDKYLSESEIKDGSFNRHGIRRKHGTRRKFIIPEKQQKKLKAKLKRATIVDIDRLLAIAK
jgi:hypothetical protein